MAATVTFPDTIRAKRDDGVLDAEAIEALVAGVSDGTLSDAQLGAFLMAVYLNGMTAQEQAALTLAMRDSGTVLEWPGLDGPVLDKHSTGGVGDLVSLVLAPMLATCGAYVPMISGRGLGHTGGTLDKLESIPGFDVNPGLDAFRGAVREAGFAMVGQGPDLAPADRRMYAVRDVTATVSCTPLIVASILSKKLAEGLDGLVMDVKVGNGAILKGDKAARALASTLCAVAEAAGLPCAAVVTDMNQPLATSVGNALEVREALVFLAGECRGTRLERVVMALGAEALVLGGLEPDSEKAEARLRASVDSGEAAERFARMVALQGGPADLLADPDQHLAKAAVVRPAPAPVGGHVQAMDARAIGRLVHGLGGGRSREDQAIDPAVGLSGLCAVGDTIRSGDPVAMIHARDDDDCHTAIAALREAVAIGPEPPAEIPTIHARIDEQALA